MKPWDTNAMMTYKINYKEEGCAFFEFESL